MIYLENQRLSKTTLSRRAMVVLIISPENKIEQKFEDVAMVELQRRTFRIIQPHCSNVTHEWPTASYRFQILPSYKEK